MQTSTLFTLLPEDMVCTPDGMAIDKDNNLILSCPNFANMDMPSCVLKIDRQVHHPGRHPGPDQPPGGQAHPQVVRRAQEPLHRGGPVHGDRVRPRRGSVHGG